MCWKGHAISLPNSLLLMEFLRMMLKWLARSIGMLRRDSARVKQKGEGARKERDLLYYKALSP